MKLGPKYKIARRLGSAVFEKTQGAKFALSEQKRKPKFSKPRSLYGTQMIEKQKVRYTYGITEKQLANYVKKVIDSKQKNQPELLFTMLEKRADSVVLRAGFASSRRHARQLVSHGHVKINGTRINIPSYALKIEDNIEIKDGSKTKGPFASYEEKFKDVVTPSWVKIDPKTMSVKLTAEPEYKSKETHLDLNTVLQFYKR
jgi:small subunit ribosomal protein S4